MQLRTKIRNRLIAALTMTLLCGTAVAAPAAAPANTTLPGTSTPIAPDRGEVASTSATTQMADQDLFCRRDAAARTGFVAPGQAASHEQAAGTVGGTLGGAALGAIIGGASGHAGTGAAIGAGAGLIAGTAIGADNARHAAEDAKQRYGAAYYACMNEANGAPPPPGVYAYDVPPPPPPYYYGPYPYPVYYPRYWGPAVTFGFGYHGHRHW